MMKELNEKFSQTDLEEHNELLEQNKKLIHELEQQIKELDHCEDKDHEEFIKEVIERIKRDIKWNVNVQTQLLEKIRN